MRLSNLITEAETSADTDMPMGTRYTLPRTVILPDTDLYYEYYRFVTAMACHPELDPTVANERSLRDVPIIVAYSPQEYEMIKAVAERMGKRIEDISIGSMEPPGGNTVSPVMKFRMDEKQMDILKALLESMESGD